MGSAIITTQTCSKPSLHCFCQWSSPTTQRSRSAPTLSVPSQAPNVILCWGPPTTTIPSATPRCPPNQRPQTLGIPPQLQPQGGRFQPFNRPPPGAPQNRPSPFTVFNPAALRGARFF